MTEILTWARIEHALELLAELITATPEQAAEAIRHPKRGKAHRLDLVTGVDTVTLCSRWARDMTERVPLNQTAPEDRCRTCWPPTD